MSRHHGHGHGHRRRKSSTEESDHVESEHPDEAKAERTVSYEELFVPYDLKGTELGMPGVVRGSAGGVRFVEQEEIDRQKGVLMDLLKKMGNNLLQGISVINISLPVRIFEPRSFLQRLTDVWQYAPLFLTRAAREKHPIERFKWTITFLIAGLHRGTTNQKPYNPILGETCQMRFPDGSKIYAEQVCHHPPVSAFLVVGPNGIWKLHGAHEYTASFRPNGLVGGQNGPTFVDFPDDGTRIVFEMPHLKLTGALFGERLFNYTDTLVFTDKKHRLKCEVTLNPDELGRFKSWIVSAKTPSDTLRGALYHNDEEICTVEGSWISELKFGDTVYWQLTQHAPIIPTPVPDDEALPSDCRFRTDMAVLVEARRSGLPADLERAEAEKSRLENIQRNDRKLRAAVAQKRQGNGVVSEQN